MRIALTLDDDLAERIAELVRGTGKPFETLLNDALRRGLGEPEFRLQPQPGNLLPSIDDHQFNELAWEVPVTKR